MSRLFIGLYLDEDVSVLVAELLRSRGYEAETAADAGNQGRSDEQQLQFAASKGLTLLTHNRNDFLALAESWRIAGRPHAGIVIATRHEEVRIVARLLKILDLFTADEIRDQLVYI
jgi:predicted nuclease of predicted toxin-antitoxin system